MILDRVAAIAEAFRDLTALWGNMTRPENDVARAYVNRILEFADLESPPPDLEQQAAELVRKASEAEDPIRGMVANLLLAVARFPRRDFAEIEAALDAAEELERNISSQDNPPAPYILWGYALLYRQANDVGEAVRWTKEALVSAKRTTSFGDWEPLTRHAVLLGELAAANGQRGRANEIHDVLQSTVLARAPQPDWLDAVLTSRIADLASG